MSSALCCHQPLHSIAVHLCSTHRFLPHFAAFFIALGVFAHVKRVNMSALGIGVDFLQIMSIFTSFGFTWPVSLKSLFSYASLTTFNDQLVAPECTVSTWTFSNK